MGPSATGIQVYPRQHGLCMSCASPCANKKQDCTKAPGHQLTGRSLSPGSCQLWRKESRSSCGSTSCLMLRSVFLLLRSAVKSSEAAMLLGPQANLEEGDLAWSGKVRLTVMLLDLHQPHTHQSWAEAELSWKEDPGGFELGGERSCREFCTTQYLYSSKLQPCPLQKGRRFLPQGGWLAADPALHDWLQGVMC